MSTLRKAVAEYIAIRRGLGTKLLRPAAALRRFIDFLECEESEFVTTELAVRWATAPAQAQPSTWAERLGVVRQFAAWMTTLDQRTEIPPPGILPARRRRTAPYIYSAEEIVKIMVEAARLPSPTGLRALTYRTLFGLLAATGLRPGEAFALDVPDVDLCADVLAVRKTKYGKTRFIPFLDSTHAALTAYAAQRDRLLSRREGDAFFVSEGGTRLYQQIAAWTFAQVSCAVGLRAPTGDGRSGCGPRLIDLRHTLTLPADAFLRRFLQHVLPHGFMRIRHYGILANGVRRDRIATCRRLLGAPQARDDPEVPETWEELLLRLTGKDVRACPSCGTGRLHHVEEIPPQTWPEEEVVARGSSP